MPSVSFLIVLVEGGTFSPLFVCWYLDEDQENDSLNGLDKVKYFLVFQIYHNYICENLIGSFFLLTNEKGKKNNFPFLIVLDLLFELTFMFCSTNIRL